MSDLGFPKNYIYDEGVKHNLQISEANLVNGSGKTLIPTCVLALFKFT